MKTGWISLAGVCALVVGMYAYTAPLGKLESSLSNPADAYYNLLVQGFRDGHLSLKKDVPPGLMRLADPYNPTTNERYRRGFAGVHDLSLYKGRLYLYFGVTPALILFWPFVALTGHYLSHRLAVLVFCTVGFLASVGVLYAMWRRYFSEVSVWVVTAGALALGLATVVPVMLPRAAYNEVAISCGYMLTMLAVGAIWGALHKPERRCWWLAAASLAYGLAVGARPTLLFGGFILLAPVIQAWREGRPVWTLLVAAITPIALIGSGVLLYNELRFDSPLEFGLHYQLARVPSMTHQFFHARFFWFNFRVYFLEPAHWSSRFPFVHDITVPPLPVGQAQVEHPFGLLTNIPLVWLALAVPLAWRHRPGREASTLRWFATAMAWLFVACALPLGFFSNAIIRFEVDYAPTLVLLAVIGILSLERALAPTPTSKSGQAAESGLVTRPVWRRAARCGWGVLLGFSVAFNLLAGVQYYAEAHYNLGIDLGLAGRIPEAIAQYVQALRINPDFPEARYSLGTALAQTGKIEEAIAQYEQALRAKPDFAEAHYSLGTALAQTGKIEEAIAQYEQALRARPDFAEAHYSLGIALYQTGKREEAMEHYEQALRIDPDSPEAHNNLALALTDAGRIPEAITHLQEALRLRRTSRKCAVIWGSPWAWWAGYRKPSCSTSRPCGSGPISPRPTTIWGKPWCRWDRCRRRSSIWNRRCGSSPITPRRRERSRDCKLAREPSDIRATRRTNPRGFPHDKARVFDRRSV